MYKRQYRKFTVQQKAELVLASFRGDRSIAEICREHEISETSLRRWREQFLVAGAEWLSGRASAPRLTSYAVRCASSSGRWDATTLEVEVAGNLLRMS